jgi:bifunctional UDP-N-acetylglucosamine pyrophosphorylase/glucosamine-1-phosphate N-acetyltransferase
MNADRPKAALQVGGRPMASRVIEALKGAGVSRIVTVVGHRADDVQVAVGDGVEYVVQEEQLGTGHAAHCAEACLSGCEGPVVVAYADIPLLRSVDVVSLVEGHVQSGAAATLLTAIFEDPKKLGRILRDDDGRVRGIIETRDASEEQLKIKEINVGVYCFDGSKLFRALAQVKNENAQHQYYLTDTVGILVESGERVEAVVMEVAHAGIGVNTAEDLARAQRLSALDQAYT